jgi:hypothetical protein
MLWSANASCPPISCGLLQVSCSPNPAVAGSWKLPVTLITSNKTVRWGAPDLAVSGTGVAVAYTGSGGPPPVSFGFAPGGDCSTGPATFTLTTLGSGSTAGAPSVALGPPGGATLWGAWIETVGADAVVRVNR